MYKIVFTQRVLKDLKDIQKEIQIRIAKQLKKYRKNPLKYARNLISPKIGTYRYRTGDYRIVFDIKGKNIVVLRIGHRREIYK